MLKYVVVAVFSICVLPCFAAAQDCGCGGSVIDAPVIDHGVDAGISDCGCDAAPAPAGPSCGCAGGRLRGMVGGLGGGRLGGRLGGGGCGAAPVADCGCGG